MTGLTEQQQVVSSDTQITDQPEQIMADSRKSLEESRRESESADRDPSNGDGPVKQAERFPIVALGASAGGLEALREFFESMPANSGMAFVIVMHLDPNRISILPDLIQKYTAMPVCQVTTSTRVVPNHVYVISPRRDLGIINGDLLPVDKLKMAGASLPIDSFLRILATDQGPYAVSVILSGTGTDGTLGLKSIKEHQGLVMVQSVESAKYDGMPRSAIGTGLVDQILPVAEMPEQLKRHALLLSRTNCEVSRTTPQSWQSALQRIFIILRSTTKHDFSLYKKNTICRRIERRMNVHQLDSIDDYVSYLKQTEREQQVLFKELLIGVTSFFRDPEAFERLGTKYLPKLLEHKPTDDTIRVWVPGCSSGEEVYSIAIVIQECLAALNRDNLVQIFGTDIDSEAIDLARRAQYPENIRADVDSERLQRHFIKGDDGYYRVKRNIREMAVFAIQNVIKDPPFTKLDLLSCRNLLIYFGSELQRKLLPVFNYSLKPDGMLFLGSCETVGTSADLFEPVDKKWRVFQALAPARAMRPLLTLPIPFSGSEGDETRLPPAARRARELNDFQLVQTILERSDASPCVIVDDRNDIVYVHGRTGQFLEPAPGKVNVNVIEMARPGLKPALLTALREVSLTRRKMSRRIRVQFNGEQQQVDLTVKPVSNQGRLKGLVMIIFQTIPSTKTGEQPPLSAVQLVDDNDTTESYLELELQYTKETLQTTIEELETSNEELQSTNEELQSTNEEIETSKEELQSLNEESLTVNAELQTRVDELSRAHDDLKNLLDSTEIATLFLDMDLKVRRFTPSMSEIIPLTQHDAGRPLSHFVSKLAEVDLSAIATEVLNDLATRSFEVSTQQKNFNMRVRPYRTTNNVIDGVVITFNDITQAKRLENVRRSEYTALQQRLGYTGGSEVKTDRDVHASGYLAVVDQAGNILFVNKELPWSDRIDGVAARIDRFFATAEREVVQSHLDSVLASQCATQFACRGAEGATASHYQIQLIPLSGPGNRKHALFSILPAPGQAPHTKGGTNAAEF